ncbi:MAG: thioredoxin, partial [Oscillibacter sp.]|nr:thioredoxin [Oscillibacter sp.]
MALQHLTEDTFDAAVNAAPLAMVDFWATWCGPCKMMGPIVEKLAVEYDGKALVAKVDTDEEADLAEKFDVSTIPTLVFLKNGAEFDRKIGVTPEAALREVLDA